jgi:hypothetical protein
LCGRDFQFGAFQPQTIESNHIPSHIAASEWMPAATKEANMSQTVSAAQSASLRCIAGKGMFPYEAGVLIRGADQYYESMIDRDLVHTRRDCVSNDAGEIEALVHVDVIKVNGDRVLVELPRQVVSGGRRIWVSKTEVEMHGDPVSSSNCQTPGIGRVED